MGKLLRIRNIHLTGYKNYSDSDFVFDERITGICGNNGKGKTNLLDAIYYLCFTKSYFTRTDNLNVRFGQEGFRLEGSFDFDGTDKQKVVCIYRLGKGKEIYCNDVAYEKFSRHIGRFPSVVIAPDDIELIIGGSEERRRYLDTLISQTDNEYLQQLILYNKLLSERNALLRSENENHRREDLVLQSLDERLIPAGQKIHNKRKEFCKKLFPQISEFYLRISSSAENISIHYESGLKQSGMKEILSKNIHRDRAAMRTTEGIHKDDIIFEFKSNLFKNISSQGQKKSLLFACRLAELEILKKETGISPLLLLDDVFEKLDSNRIQNLLEYICSENDSQVFITDTDEVRLRNAVEQLNNPVKIIQLN